MESDRFKRVLSGVDHYYREADKLITDKASPSCFTSTISKINSYSGYLDKLLMKLTVSIKQLVKAEFENAAKEQQVEKSMSDLKLAEYLKVV